MPLLYMNENIRKGTASSLILTDNRAKKAALESRVQLPLSTRQSGCHESLTLTLKFSHRKAQRPRLHFLLPCKVFIIVYN